MRAITVLCTVFTIVVEELIVVKYQNFIQASLPEGMIPVRQTLRGHGLPDVETGVLDALRQPQITACIRPGMRIAITGSSRGIQNLALILRTVVRWIRAAGGEPFIIPAMGSHGGATAEGQLEVLHTSGVTEAYCECPIHASMEVVNIGSTALGSSVYIDKYAAQADGIVLVNRVKPHTSFHGKYESGLMKMLAIGLGKQYGAQICHEFGFGSMHLRIPEFANAILAQANVLFGLAILENAREETEALVALPAARIPVEEPALLKTARELQAKIPFSSADVLILDAVGKEFSGSGFDTNIAGRYLDPVSGSREYKDFGFCAQKIVALDLSERSHGNAAGIGLTDFITTRLFSKIDRVSTYLNCITAHDTYGMFMPPHFESDEETIRAALYFCPKRNRSSPRVIRVHDTLHLEEFLVSPAFLPEIENDPTLSILGPARPWPFDEHGNLLDL